MFYCKQNVLSIRIDRLKDGLH